MLLSFVLFIAPGLALMYVIYRFIKTKHMVTLSQIDAARDKARLEAAQRASLIAQGTAREAMVQTGQALTVARTIELVDEKVTSLTDYLVSQIEGDTPAPPPAGRHARHAVSGGDDQSAIAAPAGARDQEAG